MKRIFLLTLMFSFCLLPSALASEIVFKNIPMSTIDSDNGKLVYMSYKDGDFEIFLYNTESGEETQITNDNKDQGYPAISGKYIVWMDNRDEATIRGFDIILYNVETHEEKKISQSPGSNEYPDIYGNIVVWEEHSANLSNIVSYKIDSGNISLVSENAIKGYNPKISGDIVTWTDVRYDNPDIYAVDLSNGLEITVAEGSAIQFNATVSEGKIVWIDDRNGNKDIYLFDILSNTETQVTSGSGNELSPLIVNNTVIFKNSSGNPVVYNIENKNETIIDTQGKSAETFFIVDDQINWTSQSAPISIENNATSRNDSKSTISLFDSTIDDTLQYYNPEKGILINTLSGFENPSRVIIKELQEKEVSLHPALSLVSGVISIQSSEPMKNGFKIGILPTVVKEVYNKKMGIYYDDGNGWKYIGGKWSSGGFICEVNKPYGGYFAVFISEISFLDSDKHWAKEAIEILAAKQIINGYMGGKFAPERQITRAEFISMLVKTLNLKLISNKSYFKDVSPKHWANSFIETAFANGLITGNNGMLRPDELITREEMAVIIVRAQEKIREYEYKDYSPVENFPNYKDSSMISPWARAAVGKASWSGLLKGSSNRFLSQKNLTRGETATVLFRFYEKNFG